MNTPAPPLRFSYILGFIAFMLGIAMPLRASGVAPQQAALGLALVASIFVLVRSIQSRAWFKDALCSTQAKIIAAIFLVWSITAFFSFDVTGSFKMIARSGGFILAATAMGSVLYNRQDAHKVLFKALIISAIVLTFAAVLSLNGVPMILSAFKGKIIMGARPIFALKAFAAVALCLIPVVTFAGYKLGRCWWWAGFIYTPLALITIVSTHNRAALAGFMIMALTTTIAFVVAKRRHIRLLIGTTGTIVMAGIAWVYSIEKETVHLKGSYLPEWLVDPHRQNIWKYAYERFLDHPWVGNGIDQLNRLPGAKLPVPGLGQSAAWVPSHPHNWAMEILSEAGLIGFLPILFTLGFVAWQLLKRYRATHNEADLARLALMAAFWSSALFNFSIWAAWWQLTFFVLFAIMSCSREQQIYSSNTSNPPSPTTRS
ncbi:MAG: O-antigen ligase family protein [Magnetovibrio sp.]|nr:O-antigen ligase family protein [Magnetovibrio sp.]